jgi:hypothetical protein
VIVNDGDLYLIMALTSPCVPGSFGIDPAWIGIGHRGQVWLSPRVELGIDRTWNACWRRISRFDAWKIEEILNKALLVVFVRLDAYPEVLGQIWRSTIGIFLTLLLQIFVCARKDPFVFPSSIFPKEILKVLKIGFRFRELNKATLLQANTGVITEFDLDEA